jgi:hypothetical protein
MLELLVALVEMLVAAFMTVFHLLVLGVGLVGSLIGLMIEGRGRNDTKGPPETSNLPVNPEL